MENFTYEIGTWQKFCQILDKTRKQNRKYSAYSHDVKFKLFADITIFHS